MRTALLALLALVPAVAAAAEPCPTLQPGKAFDRFSLGTVLKEDSAVTPDALPGWSRPKTPGDEAVRLQFDPAKKLAVVDAPLPACLTLAGASPVTLKAPTLRQVAAALRTCGPEQIREGGNRIECAGLALTTGMGARGLESRIVVRADAVGAKVPCDVYLDADGATDAETAPAPTDSPAKLEVGGRNVCVTGRHAPVSAATRPGDLASASCTTEALRGGTHVKCGATTFHFAGPTLALQSITITR